MNTQQATPTQEDRILAALAHVSAVLPFMGVVAPIVIWVTQKDKSQYVNFQALQATVYQLAWLLLSFVGGGCYLCSSVVGFVGLVASTQFGSPEGSPNGLAPVVATAAFIFPLLVMGLFFLGGAAFILYALVATVQVLRGKDFRYLILGARLERYLRQGRPDQPAGVPQP